MAKHTPSSTISSTTISTTRWTAYDSTTSHCVRDNERPHRGAARQWGDRYSGLISAATYDFIGPEASVGGACAGAPPGGGRRRTYFRVQVDTANAVYFNIGGRMLNCSQRIAGNSYNLATVPYDPAEHRWLRLRDQAEVLYWEVSADGCEWVTLARNGNPLGSQPGGPASAVTLEIGAAVYRRGFAGRGGLRQLQHPRLQAGSPRRRAPALGARHPRGSRRSSRRAAPRSTPTTTTRSTTRPGRSPATTPRA